MRRTNCRCAAGGGWTGVRGGSVGPWVLSPPRWQRERGFPVLAAPSWLHTELLPSAPCVYMLAVAPRIPSRAGGVGGAGAAPLGVGGGPWGAGGMQMSGASRKSPLGVCRPWSSRPGRWRGLAQQLAWKAPLEHVLGPAAGGRVCPGDAGPWQAAEGRVGADPALLAAPPPPPPMLRNGGRDAPPPPPPYRLHPSAEPPSRGKPPPPPTRTPAGPPPPPPPVRNGHRDSISTVRAFLGEWDPGCGSVLPEEVAGLELGGAPAWSRALRLLLRSSRAARPDLPVFPLLCR